MLEQGRSYRDWRHGFCFVVCVGNAAAKRETMNRYKSYEVKVQATTPQGTKDHTVTVYASGDAEASEFAADEVAIQYRGREVEIDVIEMVVQRNRL